MKTRIFPLLLILSAVLLSAQTVTFTAVPKTFQLYPRDVHDSAAVTLAGSVITSGTDSVSVKFYKNGSQISRLVQTLQYGGGSADETSAVEINLGKSSE